MSSAEKQLRRLLTAVVIVALVWGIGSYVYACVLYEDVKALQTRPLVRIESSDNRALESVTL